MQAARPCVCPECKAPSCPVGEPIQLHGHGLRERQVLGPPSPGEGPTKVVVEARRYRCLACRAVVIVVPRGVVTRRRYSAQAIGFALALWALVKVHAVEVRRRVSPVAPVGFDTALGWPALRRWARAVKEGRLFRGLPAAGLGATLREVAATATSALAAAAGSTSRGLGMAERAFLGAAQGA